ncbi:SPOC like C-terminal domain-containing protein [Lobosporangium transversale]|uniref:ATP-dependent DNA helicase II subunit 1 n=1 Tax=Lobosporangium transversale TaxID=64571 RepID=A0A1Y2GTG5_9FUNG|nr:SPOC like C-terminal domain-containing protein [Lobosporangium transversale]ORZ22807.1 SPOC like C-terminal domain-containing protein [Lobosporangium transversale]|eukprot:XP_021883361.1 SPOC like C-terminal domain-containing protein [Lobosporangium transversale]
MSYSSSWRSGYDDLEDDADENILTDAQETQWSSRDSILFVIDCSPAMLKASEDGEIPFYTAIKCAMAVQLNKIISSESDLVGVIFYGTEKSKNANNFEHIYVLQDLETPDVSKIQQLEAIDDKTIDFNQEFGTSNGKYTLGEMFWTATSLFGSSAQRIGSKRLFLFTNEDDPHSGDISLRSASKVRANDLQQFGIKIELFDIDKPGEKFNRKTFYKDILIDVMDDDEEGTTDDVSTKLSELLQRVQRKEVKKRAYFNIPLKLAPGLEIGVKGYNLVLAQGKGAHRNVYTLGEAVREVQTVTTWLCADTAQYLMPTDLKYYWEFGGVKVVFSKDEVAGMKSFGPPGLALIGFKPRSAIRMHLNIAHAMFLYPDEKSYEGSTRAFSSLLKAMAEMDKVAICSFTQRKGYSTRLVALIPQLEVVSENGQEQPPGFQLIQLPWADDIRPLPIQTDYTPPMELIDAAKGIISKLNMKKGFQPDNYENPSLQKHYKVLQATALNQLDMDIDDKTLPKTEQMHQRAGEYIRNFKDVASTIEPPEPSIDSSLASSKRPSQSQESSASKKSKSTQASQASQPSDNASLLADMRFKYDGGQLNKATVAMLKEFLSSVNLKPNGSKKADLISQVEAYFAN